MRVHGPSQEALVELGHSGCLLLDLVPLASDTLQSDAMPWEFWRQHDMIQNSEERSAANPSLSAGQVPQAPEQEGFPWVYLTTRKEPKPYSPTLPKKQRVDEHKLRRRTSRNIPTHSRKPGRRTGREPRSFVHTLWTIGTAWLDMEHFAAQTPSPLPEGPDGVFLKN